MNKRELIARVQRHMGAGASRDAARAAVDAVLGAILRQAAEQKVHLRRFGSFEYRLHRERSGFDLEAACLGAPKATRRLAFTPANRLRETTTGPCHATPLPQESPGQ